MYEETPWFAEYDVFGIPKTLKPYPEKPVGDILVRAAQKFPNRGLVQGPRFLSYPDLLDQVDRLATALAGMGLVKGDRVATILPTSIPFVVADYAIGRAGLVHIPSSHLEPIPTLVHKFTKGGPKALLCMYDHAAIAEELRGQTPIETVVVTRLCDWEKPGSEPKPNLSLANCFWMDELIAKTAPAPPRLAWDVQKDLETLLFTGGTTGLPKGCMLSHSCIHSNAIQNDAFMGAAGKIISGAVSILLGVPFFHSYGHIVMHTVTLMGANQLLVPDSRDTDAMAAMIKEHRPAIQIGVPTQFMKLAGDKLKGSGILGMSGSAPLPPNTQKEFEKASGGGIMEGYGLSEMGPVTHLNTSFLLRILGGRGPARFSNILLKIPGVTFLLNRLLRLMGPQTVGYLFTRLVSVLVKLTSGKGKGSKNEKRGTAGIPYPDTEIRILDVNTGAQIPISEVVKGRRGELCMRGPQRMLGYWPDAGSGMDRDGFIHTSDVVEIDERGYFFIVDRTKDMIIVSGYKVYSREVDDILYDHPAVEIAATVGVPDPEREGSERVAVFVQPKPEFKGKVTEAEIIEYLRARIAKYAVPKQVFMVDAIPLTEVHKVNKKVLREQAKQTGKAQ
ncbi:MAG: AMP-binding protein [Thermodesulfobacteriota bacterium]